MFTYPGKVSKCRGAHVTRPQGRAGRNPPGTREHTAEPGGRLQLKVDNSTSRRRVGVRVWGVGAGCGRGVRAWGAGVGCGRGVRVWGAGVGCGTLLDAEPGTQCPATRENAEADLPVSARF